MDESFYNFLLNDIQKVVSLVSRGSLVLRSELGQSFNKPVSVYRVEGHFLSVKGGDILLRIILSPVIVSLGTRMG